MTDLSFDEARRLFTYRDGLIYWKPRRRHDFKSEKDFLAWNRKYPGTTAGAPDKRGYCSFAITLDGVKKRYLVHRVVWSWHNGPAEDEVDHKDNNPSNNLIENLRAATGSQNKANRRTFKVTACSFNGVSYEADRRRWKAGIRTNGVSKTIGRFKCPTLAAVAYDREAYAAFGEFAVLNFPALVLARLAKKQEARA